MRKWIKHTLLALVVCAVGLAGYVFGYFQGYLGGVGHPALANAFNTVVKLINLRDGKPDPVIQSLEVKLDTALLMHSKYQESPLQISKIFESGDDSSLRKTVREYREKHPSVIEDATIKAKVQHVLQGEAH